MSKLKAIGKIVDEVKPLKKATGGKISHADEPGSIDVLLTEYSNMKQAEREGNITESEDAFQRLLKNGPPDFREKALFDPTIDRRLAFEVQTESPEEFSKRYREQFRDRDFAYRAAFGNDPHDTALAHLNMGPGPEQIKQQMGERAINELTFQFTVGRKVFNPIRSPRARSRALEWLGESPYVREGKDINTPQIFVHMDRWADPNGSMMSQDPIQFSDEANELGMHSGSYLAAEQASVRDINEVMFRHQDFQNDIEQFAGLSDNPERVKEMIVETLEANLVDKFKSFGKEGWGKVGQDLQDELNMLLVELGVPNPSMEVATFLSRLRSLPVPSTTPHLFRGKNGLYLRDMGGFGPEEIGRQLKLLYPDETTKIDTILDGGGPTTTKGLRKFIEDKGFDHVIYHNSAEDKGSISIINWNPDLWMSIYDPRLHKSAEGQANAMAAYVLGLMGLGGAAVQQDIEGET